MRNPTSPRRASTLSSPTASPRQATTCTTVTSPAPPTRWATPSPPRAPHLCLVRHGRGGLDRRRHLFLVRRRGELRLLWPPPHLRDPGGRRRGRRRPRAQPRAPRPVPPRPAARVACRGRGVDHRIGARARAQLGRAGARSLGRTTRLAAPHAEGAPLAAHPRLHQGFGARQPGLGARLPAQAPQRRARGADLPRAHRGALRLSGRQDGLRPGRRADAGVLRPQEGRRASAAARRLCLRLPRAQHLAHAHADRRDPRRRVADHLPPRSDRPEPRRPRVARGARRGARRGAGCLPRRRLGLGGLGSL